jgi:hypothetical protein
VKLRRNEKNGKPYGSFFIALGRGQRHMLHTKDRAEADRKFREYKASNGKPADPLAPFHPPPSPPIALLSAIETPAPPAAASSSAPPPAAQGAPADDSWVKDFAGASSSKAHDADDDDLDPEVARELLETAGNVLVEAQLMAQAWLLRRYKKIEAAPVDPEHQLRKMGRAAWAKQFRIWWPDLAIPPWAVALGATGMAVMVQVGEGATRAEAPPRAQPRPAAAPSSPTSTPAAPPAEAAAA